jgi:hypothetical protein
MEQARAEVGIARETRRSKPMRNVVGKKGAGQEDVASDYLFGNFL